MDLPPFIFSSLPKKAFPLTIRAFRDDNGEEVWREEVSGPCAIEVPALREQLGVTCSIRVETANGEVRDSKDRDHDGESFVVCAPYTSKTAHMPGNQPTECFMCATKVVISEEARELGAIPVCLSCAADNVEPDKGFAPMPPEARKKTREKLAAEMGEKQADAVMGLLEKVPVKKAAEMVEKVVEEEGRAGAARKWKKK